MREGKQRAASTTGSSRTLRTPVWTYLQGNSAFSAESADTPLASGDTFEELFAKPDDRWEANEISDRCAEIAAAMDQQIESFGRAAATETLDQLQPLDVALWSANSV